MWWQRGLALGLVLLFVLSLLFLAVGGIFVVFFWGGGGDLTLDRASCASAPLGPYSYHIPQRDNYVQTFATFIDIKMVQHGTQMA